VYLNHLAMINLPDTPDCTLLVVSSSTHVHTKAKPDPSHWCPVTKSNGHRLKYKTFNSKLRKINSCEGSQAVAELFQAHHRASIPGDTQNTAGHSLEQPVLSRGVRLDALQSFLPNPSNFVILCSFNYLHQAFDLIPILSSHQNTCTSLKIHSQYGNILNYLWQNSPKWIFSNF